MIDSGAVTDWQKVETKDVLTFEAENPRAVTLYVMSNGPASVYVRPISEGAEEVDLYLVGYVVGLEKLRFEVPGAYEVIQASEDSVSVYMKIGDGAVLHRDNLDENTFTKMYVARTIDPNVQRVLDAMQKQHMLLMHDLRYSRQKEWDDGQRSERTQNVSVPDTQQADDGDASAEASGTLEPPVSDQDGQ